MAGAAWLVHPVTETRGGDKGTGTLGASAFASLSGTLAEPGGGTGAGWSEGRRGLGSEGRRGLESGPDPLPGPGWRTVTGLEPQEGTVVP
jgi:hypothetical protein